MSNKKYWFKPARFWKYFAFYYPVSYWGYFITLTCLWILVKVFWLLNLSTHSVSDLLINFSPWVIVVMIIFDIFCRIFGEFPYWWRKRNK